MSPNDSEYRFSRDLPQSRRGNPRGQSPDSERRSPVSFRTSALAFLDGALERWGIHHLVTWMDQCLIRPGRLLTRHPFPRVTVWERGLGELSYGNLSGHADPALYLPHGKASTLIDATRARVFDTLSGLHDGTPDDRFVQAAIYDGRVVRRRQPSGQRSWEVMLTERHQKILSCTLKRTPARFTLLIYL